MAGARPVAVAAILCAMSETPIRIFCGADRSQHLPFLVLADSIRRHSARAIEIRAIDNADAPPVADPRCAPYTEFSFARFAIPALCEHRGHAVYMDSDMLVFHDIGELWDTPLDGAAIAIEIGSRSAPASIAHARNRHAAVMLMDCAKLPWDVAEIVARLGRDYDYNALMSVDPVLPSPDWRQRLPLNWGELDGLDDALAAPDTVPGGAGMHELLPVGWNDLDRYDPARTRNLHFTEIRTQPWVSPQHPHGALWVAALRRMLDAQAIDADAVREEVALGHVRPSLLLELGLVPVPADALTPKALAAHDETRGFVAHRKLLARFAERKRAIARFERDRAVAAGGPQALWQRLRYRLRHGRD